MFHVGKYSNVPSRYGNAMGRGYQGTTIPYQIAGGKLITFVSQDPYAVTVYKLGDTYCDIFLAGPRDPWAAISTCASSRT